MKRFTLLLCFFSLLPLPAYAAAPRVIQSEKVTFSLEEIVDGLGVPWGLAFIGDTR